MWRWYLARKFWKYRRFSIKAFGTLLGVLLTIFACASLSKPVERGNLDQERPDLTIEGPLGTYRIYGAQEWLEPVIEQGRRMNRIEALENHAQWPEMSPNPEDYTDGI